MACSGAAELFGARDAEKAQFGEALPQFAIIGLLAIEHRAHRLGRAFFGEKLPGLVAELFLFVGEIEIHGVLLLLCETCSYVAPANAGTHNHRRMGLIRI